MTKLAWIVLLVACLLQVHAIKVPNGAAKRNQPDRARDELYPTAERKGSRGRKSSPANPKQVRRRTKMAKGGGAFAIAINAAAAAVGGFLGGTAGSLLGGLIDTDPTPVPTPGPTPATGPTLGPTRLGDLPFDEKILLCRQVPGRENVGMDESNPDFSSGEPIFSDVTQTEANTDVTDALTVTQGVVDVASDIADLFKKTKALSNVLSAVSGVLGVVTHFAGKSETDLLKSFLQEEFDKLNQGIGKLSILVSQGFDDVRRDLADNALDEIMAPLQAMDFAYREMVQTFNEVDSPALKRSYTTRYRQACNVPHAKPEDLFRELYGFACGGEGADRACTDGTGTCSFGAKKRQFALEIYADVAAGDSVDFQEFIFFLLNAMNLAQIHTALCLPAEAASCTDFATDPARDSIVKDQNSALIEVVDNLDRTSVCFAEEFMSNINRELLRDVPANNDCLTGDANDQDKNLCMATATEVFISERFDKFDWMVVVYNFQPDSQNIKRNVDFDGEKGEEYGYFNFPPTGGDIGDRHFHLMYRLKVDQGGDLKKTDVINDANVLTFLEAVSETERDMRLDDVLPLICSAVCTCMEADKFWNDNNDGFTCCVRDPDNNKARAAKQHGFIVFRTNQGIPRAFSGEHRDRFDVRFGEDKFEASTSNGGIDGTTCEQQVELVA